MDNVITSVQVMLCSVSEEIYNNTVMRLEGQSYQRLREPIVVYAFNREIFSLQLKGNFTDMYMVTRTCCLAAICRPVSNPHLQSGCNLHASVKPSPAAWLQFACQCQTLTCKGLAGSRCLLFNGSKRSQITLSNKGFCFRNILLILFRLCMWNR